MRLVLLALCALVVAAVPSSSGDSPATRNSGGWVLLEMVGLEDAFVTVNFTIREDPAIAYAFLIRQQDGVTYIPNNCEGPTPALASAGAAGEEIFHFGEPVIPFIDITGQGCGVGFRLFEDEPVWFVGLVGGDVSHWGYTVENAVYTELARGPVHAFDPRDFTPAGADARVMSASVYGGVGSRSIEIEHELVGVAGDPIVPTIGLFATTPKDERLCRCYFPSPYQPQPSVYGPGTYTFTLTGAGARAYHGPMVVVADVPIPRLQE